MRQKACELLSEAILALQIYALPSMELVFDHSPVTEGLATLTGDPGTENPISDNATEEEKEDTDEAYSARPVVVETRMECFAQSSEKMQADEDR